MKSPLVGRKRRMRSLLGEGVGEILGTHATSSILTTQWGPCRKEAGVVHLLIGLLASWGFKVRRLGKRSLWSCGPCRVSAHTDHTGSVFHLCDLLSLFGCFQNLCLFNFSLVAFIIFPFVVSQLLIYSLSLNSLVILLSSLSRIPYTLIFKSVSRVTNFGGIMFVGVGSDAKVLFSDWFLIDKKVPGANWVEGD